jgi:hypothetical protein
MRHYKLWAAISLLALAVLVVLPDCVRAQEGSNPPPSPTDLEGQPPQADAQDPNTNQSPALPPQATPTPGYPIDSQIHFAGRATPWANTDTPLRFGPISVSNIDLIGVYDQFTPSNATQVTDTRFGILRGVIVFAANFKKNVFVVQYTPQLVVLNGKVRGGADGNQAVSLGQVLNITPKLSVTVKNDFAFTQSRQLYPDQFLYADRQTGGVLQNYLLETTGRTISDAFQTVFNYNITPRLILTVDPGYYYANATFTAGTYATEASKNMFSLTYALTPRRRIGIIQTADYQHSLKPPPSDFFYHITGLFYSEQFSPTLWITGTLGYETTTNLNTSTSTSQAAGSFTLLKALSRSEISLAYNRQHTITYFATNQQVESVDINYTYVLSQRLKWNNGVGYIHELGANPRIAGKYAISTLEYHLAGGFSLLTSYSRRNQQSTSPELLAGNRNTYIAGIRWSPPTVLGH